MTKWSILYSQIAVAPGYGIELAAKPFDALLNQGEAALRHPFPSDYRSFILAFGAGELTVYATNDLSYSFQIFSPGCETPACALENENHVIQRAISENYPNEPSLKLHRSLCCFAASVGGDLYGWNFADPLPSPEIIDYSIHLWPAGTTTSQQIALSFREFIERVCFGDAYFPLWGQTDAVIECREFLPAAKPKMETSSP